MRLSLLKYGRLLLLLACNKTRLLWRWSWNKVAWKGLSKEAFCAIRHIYSRKNQEIFLQNQKEKDSCVWLTSLQYLNYYYNHYCAIFLLHNVFRKRGFEICFVTLSGLKWFVWEMKRWTFTLPWCCEIGILNLKWQARKVKHQQPETAERWKWQFH